jgi:hypothetical protein
MSTSSLTRPAGGGVAVTPSDSTVLPVGCRSLWVGTSGNLAVGFPDGSSVVIPSASGVIPVQARMVLLTGTTASGIVALY